MLCKWYLWCRSKTCSSDVDFKMGFMWNLEKWKFQGLEIETYFKKRDAEAERAELRTEGSGVGTDGGEHWHRRLVEGAVPGELSSGRSARTMAVGWGWEAGPKRRGYMYTYSGFMLLCSGSLRQRCQAIILQLIQGYTVQHREYGQCFVITTNGTEPLKIVTMLYAWNSHTPTSQF